MNKILNWLKKAFKTESDAMKSSSDLWPISWTLDIIYCSNCLPKQSKDCFPTKITFRETTHHLIRLSRAATSPSAVRRTSMWHDRCLCRPIDVRRSTRKAWRDVECRSSWLSLAGLRFGRQRNLNEKKYTVYYWNRLLYYFYKDFYEFLLVPRNETRPFKKIVFIY